MCSLIVGVCMWGGGGWGGGTIYMPISTDGLGIPTTRLSGLGSGGRRREKDEWDNLEIVKGLQI